MTKETKKLRAATETFEPTAKTTFVLMTYEGDGLNASGKKNLFSLSFK